MTGAGCDGLWVAIGAEGESEWCDARGGGFSSAPRLANLSLFDASTPGPDASSQLFDVLYAPGPGASVLFSLKRLDVDAENILSQARPQLDPSHLLSNSWARVVSPEGATPLGGIADAYTAFSRTYPDQVLWMPHPASDQGIGKTRRGTGKGKPLI